MRLESAMQQRVLATDAPAFDPADYPGQKAMILQGAVSKSFAYVGFPDNASAENPVPAVVLVHGGGGVAFPEWVRLWNQRGYAAIAFSNTGFRPTGPTDSFVTDGTWTREPLGDPFWNPGPLNDGMKNSTAPLEEQWMFHALTLTVAAHNWLRQNEKVDTQRIGLVGISWGGVISSLMLGYDTRYAFAVPVYGCGFLEESRGWMGSLFSPKEVQALWAAGDRLPAVSIPVLWVCWANDPCFSIHSNSHSYTVTPGSTLSIQMDMGHSHPCGWMPPEIMRFADSVVKNGQPLTGLTSESAFVWKVTLPKDAEAVSVCIRYLTEQMTYSPNGVLHLEDGTSSIDQVWQTKPCCVENERITVDLPKDAIGYYLEVTTCCAGQEYVVTSAFAE